MQPQRALHHPRCHRSDNYSMRRRLFGHALSIVRANILSELLKMEDKVVQALKDGRSFLVCQMVPADLYVRLRKSQVRSANC